MKPRPSQIRAKEFEVADLERQLRLFDQMIRDLAEIRDELDRQVDWEEKRTGVRETTHFAYSTVARAARERRHKLEASIADLERRRGLVEQRLSDAVADLSALKPAHEDEHRPAARFEDARFQIA